MAKQKTRKAAAKRFRVSARGKALRRHTMQDHFNVGRPKKTIRGRRRDRTVSRADKKRLARLLPFAVPSLLPPRASALPATRRVEPPRR